MIKYSTSKRVLLEESFEALPTPKTPIIKINESPRSSDNEVEEIFKKLSFNDSPHEISISESHNNSNDDLEDFFTKLKIQNISKLTNIKDVDTFIISSSEEETDNEPEVYENFLKLQVNDIVEDVKSTPIVKTKGNFPKFCLTVKREPKILLTENKSKKYCKDDELLLNKNICNEKFLASLNCTNYSNFNLNKYILAFQRNKDALVDILYGIYNKDIFQEKLPNNMQITWNPRLTKTAGRCYNTFKKHLDPKNEIYYTKFSKIELSEKICDSAERLRDVLIHEVCHAAVWLFTGHKKYSIVSQADLDRGGHGRLWKWYARKCNETFPCLKPIARCHNYSIATKYIYRCNTCSKDIGRHSKSIDIQTNRCALCGGTFSLLVWRKRLQNYVSYEA